MEPCLLIASPQMRDAFFERTVVLLWHHDDEGAIGVVVNRPLDHPLSAVLSEHVDDYDGATVGWGGPVERTSGTVVARARIDEEDGWPLDAGIAVTRSEETLRLLISQHADLMLCLGYAGWGPGQLDREIEDGGWLYTDLQASLLFDTPPQELYERALATLGLTPSTVLMTPADA